MASWQFHRSALLQHRRTPWSHEELSVQLDLLLHNLALQTSLDIRRELRPTEVLQMVEDHPATSSASPMPPESR
jgi:hypothetical protein